MISFDAEKEGELTSEEEEEQDEENESQDPDSGQPSPVSLEATIEPKSKSKSKNKTKGGSKLASKKIDKRAASSRGDVLREQGKCAFCGNLLLQTDKIHYQDVKGLKEQMRAAGKLSVALCDDCQANLDAGKTVDLKTAIVEGEDGSIQNVAISDILMAEQQEELLQKGRKGK